MDIQPSVLAIAAHPDDIEFVMAGTLMRLAEAGWAVHYFNIANGCCGSADLTRSACARVRLAEAQQAASRIPATFYPPIRNDLEIFYDAATHQEVAAIVRRARPSIVLTHALADYMEDHQNAARLAVGGAFVRGMPNFGCAGEPFDAPIAVYHAQPHGNRDPMGARVVPSHFVNVTDIQPRKRELLACHASQDSWLDASQKMSSYLQAMDDLNREVGQLSGRYTFAEGWRQHIHLGLAEADFDPLRRALSAQCHVRDARPSP